MRDEPLTHLRLFGKTPGDFSAQVEQTLLRLPEIKRRRASLRGVPVAACLLLMIAGAALAAVGSGGLSWFYKNVFHTPTLPNNVEQSIQSAIPQKGEHPLLNLGVASAVWLPREYDLNYPEEMTLEVLVLAALKDSQSYELHPSDKLDRDGLREERREDYLETKEGVGPVQDMMDDPGKELLFYSLPDYMTLTPEGDPMTRLKVSFYYQTFDESGNVASFFSFHVDDGLLQRLAALADAQGTVSMVYTDYSWLYSSQGTEKDHPQQGTVIFSLSLPEGKTVSSINERRE